MLVADGFFRLRQIGNNEAHQCGDQECSSEPEYWCRIENRPISNNDVQEAKTNKWAICERDYGVPDRNNASPARHTRPISVELARPVSTCGSEKRRISVIV